jgi:chromosome segregation ATPase
MSEELLQQLIHMVAENNRLVKETQQELREFKKEMYDFRDEMYAFRDEMYEFRDDATRRLDRLERHQNKHIDADLDLLHRKVSDHEREINRIKQVGQ